MSEIRESVTRFGYLGLIPFFTMAGAVWVLPEHISLTTSLIFLSYSSVILSLLGGLVWGTALRKQGNGDTNLLSLINIGIFASLISWFTLAFAVLLSNPNVYILALAVNGLMFYQLRRAELKHLLNDYETWFDELRTLLTKVVLACHFSVVIYCIVY